MRTLIFLIFASLVSAWGQTQNDGFIGLSFAIDGAPARCEGFQVRLSFQGKVITPIQNEKGFEVPETFKRPVGRWKKGQLQLLYESEINWQIVSFYDDGFTWKRGDERNGWKAMGTAKTMRIAIFDLSQAAIQEYPSSEFAVTHRGPLN